MGAAGAARCCNRIMGQSREDGGRGLEDVGQVGRIFVAHLPPRHVLLEFSL